jgi:hypothetical protein
MPLKECANFHLFNGDKYGDTCPHCGLKIAEKTVAAMTPDALIKELSLPEEQWICGIVVCVEGINKGKGYFLRAGKNFIGSGDDMDIQILGDKKVNRYRHAVLVYDGEKVETLLLPGESQGMVYLEKKAVYLPTILQPYARIRIGDTSLIFAPFCGNKFNWNASPRT